MSASAASVLLARTYISVLAALLLMGFKINLRYSVFLGLKAIVRTVWTNSTSSRSDFGLIVPWCYLGMFATRGCFAHFLMPILHPVTCGDHSSPANHG